MALRETQRKLLYELDDYYWFILQQLADEAEENGDSTLSRGFLWLIKWERRPDNRKGNKYGWHFISTDSRGVTFYFDTAHQMPLILNHNYGLPSTPQASIRLLVIKTARAIGMWLNHIESTSVK